MAPRILYGLIRHYWLGRETSLLCCVFLSSDQPRRLIDGGLSIRDGVSHRRVLYSVQLLAFSCIESPEVFLSFGHTSGYR